MEQDTSNLAVWWVPAESDADLQNREAEITELPTYIAEELRDMLGRAKRGRLWVSRHLKPQISQIDWDDSKPYASKAATSGGLIIYEKDIEVLSRMPGFVTDLQMNMLRELN